jgi:hypothetical protein
MKFTLPGIELVDPPFGTAAVRVCVFPDAPTLSPDMPTREISDLGKRISSLKLSPFRGFKVKFPVVLSLTSNPVE